MWGRQVVEEMKRLLSKQCKTRAVWKIYVKCSHFPKCNSTTFVAGGGLPTTESESRLLDWGTRIMAEKETLPGWPGWRGDEKLILDFGTAPPCSHHCHWQPKHVHILSLWSNQNSFWILVRLVHPGDKVSHFEVDISKTVTWQYGYAPPLHSRAYKGGRTLLRGRPRVKALEERVALHWNWWTYSRWLRINFVIYLITRND